MKADFEGTEIGKEIEAAQNIRAMVAQTVRLVDKAILPVIQKAFLEDPNGTRELPSPQSRFNFFLDHTCCLEKDNEDGGDIFFRLLQHAFKLHEQIVVLMDDEVRAAARRVAEEICKTEEDWVVEAFKYDTHLDFSDATSPHADDGVFAFLRKVFMLSFSCAQGFCEGCLEEPNTNIWTFSTYKCSDGNVVMAFPLGHFE